MQSSASLIVALSMVLTVSGVCKAQQIHLPPAVSQSQGMGSPPVRVDDDVQRRQAQAASQQRQLEIKRDTDKMAELTQELKEFLGKNQASLMSVDAIKKADQIEKLAHNVKSKLKQGY